MQWCALIVVKGWTYNFSKLLIHHVSLKKVVPKKLFFAISVLCFAKKIERCQKLLLYQPKVFCNAKKSPLQFAFARVRQFFDLQIFVEKKPKHFQNIQSSPKYFEPYGQRPLGPLLFVISLSLTCYFPRQNSLTVFLIQIIFSKSNRDSKNSRHPLLQFLICTCSHFSVIRPCFHQFSINITYPDHFFAGAWD